MSEQDSGSGDGHTGGDSQTVESTAGSDDGPSELDRKFWATVLPDAARKSLLWKAVLGLVLATCLSAAIASYSYVGINNALESQVNQEVEATTELHASAYDDWFRDRNGEIDSIAKDLALSNGERAIFETLRTGRLEDESVRHYHYVSATTGEIIASSHDDAVGQRVPIEQSLLSRQEFVYPGRYENTEGIDVIAIGQSVPFEDRVLIAEYDAEEAGPTLEQPISGATTSVVGPNGTAVIGSPTGLSVPASTGEEVRIVQSEESIQGYHRLSSVGLIVVTQTPRDRAFAVRNVVLRSFAATILLTFFVLIGVTVIGGRSIIRDVMRLSRRVQHMEEGNLNVDLATPRDDEIGHLYAGVADMRDSLRTRIEELEAARTEAEEAKEEAQQQKQELRRQNERLERFASVVSHDLRNPLTVADGHIELAREEYDSEHLDEAAEAIERSEDLIEDILTLAREGDSVSEMEPVDLSDIVDSCWQTVMTADADLVIETDRTISADPLRLRQLLENVVRNAVEHGGRNATVTVGDLEDGTGFYVADDGPGIPSEDSDRVFESGYSTAEKGTGFGLAIVSEIAHAHGWSVNVTESRAGGARIEISDVEVLD